MLAAELATAEAAFARGTALLDGGQPEAAVASFRHVLARAPDHVGTLYNLANALRALGRPVEAAETLLLCLRVQPGFGPAHVNLADALRVMGLLAQAIPVAEQGAHLLPEQPGALLCLANCHHDAGDYAAAAGLYRQALQRVPDHAGALTSLGNTLLALGRVAEARAAQDRAVALAPHDPAIRVNRAAAALMDGDFVQGWADFEARWQMPGSFPRGFGPPWRGEALAGRTILLHAEQGLGDTLQFVRYAPLVAARGGRVVLEVQPGLARLLARLHGVAQVVTRGEALPAFDVHCPLMSLPAALATRLETIPATVPYLHAAERSPRAGGAALRFGLVWAGSGHHDEVASHLIDRRRSLPLAAFAPLAGIEGVSFVSLQKDAPAEQLRTPPPGLAIADAMGAVTDFADTADLIAGLDLVIAVDTSVAHLAAALGCPVWLLSRYDGCWRWLADRDDSPWYPTLRVYRQRRPQDWAEVVGRVAADLRRAARR